jgi:hypothetical protein
MVEILIHSSYFYGTCWFVIATVLTPSSARVGSLQLEADENATIEELKTMVAFAYGDT